MISAKKVLGDVKLAVVTIPACLNRCLSSAYHVHVVQISEKRSARRPCTAVSLPPNSKLHRVNSYLFFTYFPAGKIQNVPVTRTISEPTASCLACQSDFVTCYRHFMDLTVSTDFDLLREKMEALSKDNLTVVVYGTRRLTFI